MVPESVQAKATLLVNAFGDFISELGNELGKLFEKPEPEPTPEPTPVTSAATETPVTNQDPPEVLAQAGEQDPQTENPSAEAVEVSQGPSEFESPERPRMIENGTEPELATIEPETDFASRVDRLVEKQKENPEVGMRILAEMYIFMSDFERAQRTLMEMGGLMQMIKAMMKRGSE